MADPTVTAAAIGAVPATLGAVLAYRAARLGRSNAAQLDRQTKTLSKVEAQTNGELDNKIERAVARVLADNPEAVAGAVISEALRDLLDGILEAAQSEGDSP